MNDFQRIAFLAVCLFSLDVFADLRLEFADVELNELDARVVLRATPFDGDQPAGVIDLVAYGVVFQFDQFQNIESATATVQNVLPNMQEIASDPTPAVVSEADTLQVVTLGSHIINAASDAPFIEELGSDLIELTFAFSEPFDVGQSFRISTILEDPERVVRKTDFGIPAMLGSVRVINPFPCDINLDGICDSNDIDFLSDVVRTGQHPLRFDINGDGQVTNADREFWIVDLMNTYVGDSNLDGVFGTTDLISVFSAGEYEDGIDGNSTWATGDWNGDRDFGTPDLIAAFVQAGFEEGPRSAAATVPEPAACFPVVVGMLVLICRKRS